MIRTGLIATGIAALTAAGICFWAFGRIPDHGEIPIHWTLDGEVDRFTDRAGAMRLLLGMLGLIVAVGGLLAGAPLVDPRKAGLRKGSQGYVAVWILVLALLVLLTGGISLSIVKGAGGDTELPQEFVRFIIAGFGLLFVVMGNYLPKTRPSFTYGIRTPWTLSSDITWEKTHRLAGPLMMAAGAVGIVSAFTLDGIWILVGYLGPVFGVVAISIVYSYLVWRSATDKDEGSVFIV